MKPIHFPLLLVAALLPGCTSITGLDARSKFSCKAAPGVSCESISGVHANASAGNLPFQRKAFNKGTTHPGSNKQGDTLPAYDSVQAQERLSPREMVATYSGQPVRSPVLVLRTWVAPYEDENGDLFDQSYFYSVVHTGKWMIEANKSAISNQFRPIYPLQRPAGNAESPGSPVPPENP
jgi:conjugal transfer pilus assembly protein TraV